MSGLPLRLYLWANLFTCYSQVFGVPRTIALIRWLAPRLPLRGGSLDEISTELEAAFDRASFLFVKRKHRCLIRGFVLFFSAKRLGDAVSLQFGCRFQEDGRFRNHCWISRGGAICFEPETILAEYVPFVAYS